MSLFDADNDIMYVESTDGAGFPAIRAFAFQPIENPTPQTQRYATREEFNDTAAAAGTVSVDIPAIVRNRCRDSTSTLTPVITTATVPATVTIDDTAVVVTKT